MTFRPSPPTSVSRRNRYRADSHSSSSALHHPGPTRVKRVSRFRPPRPVSQQPPQCEDLNWPYFGNPLDSFPQDPEPGLSSSSSIVEQSSTSSHKSFPLVPFESSQESTKDDEASALPVGSVPSQSLFELRSDSEPGPFLSLQATSATDPVEQFNWTHSPESKYAHPHPPPDFPQDMSTLGYMPGLAQYNPLEPSFGGNQMDHSHYMMNSHHHLSHSSAQPVLPTPTSGPSSAFLPSFSSPGMMHSSPGLERRTSSTRPEMLTPYGQRSPYQPQHSAALRSPSLNYTSSADSASILTPPTSSSSGYSQVQQPLASQPLNQMSYSSYPSSHQQQYASSNDYLNYGSSGPSSTQSNSIYSQSSASGYPAQYVTGGMSDGSISGMDGSRNVRVINSRPKPQCWEHGCNGRQFSTFSNLLRHQREKSGTAGKSYCPRCGAEFTRTTAMKGHMNNDKCKPRRTSDAS